MVSDQYNARMQVMITRNMRKVSTAVGCKDIEWTAGPCLFGRFLCEFYLSIVSVKSLLLQFGLVVAKCMITEQRL